MYLTPLIIPLLFAVSSVHICYLLTMPPNQDKQNETFNVRMASLQKMPDTPIISIYGVNEGSQGIYAVDKGNKGFLSMILIVWDDGRIIWSKDCLKGGPPYYQNKVEATKIDELLNKFNQDGVFCSSQSNKYYYGRASDFIGIAICDGNDRLYLRSWHERFEDNPNLVATHTGITSLKYYDGLSRQEVLDKEPEDYKEFRRIWNIVREEAKKLIPEDGQIIEDAKFETRRL